MKFALLTLAGAVLFAAPAIAQTTAAAADPAPAKPAAPRERMICREDNEIGSLVKKQRICMTATQWREQAARQGGDMERREVQRSGAADHQ